MEAPMGKTFHLFATDPVIRRRLQQAHELRNAYLRAALTRLFRRLVAPPARPRPDASAGAVRATARIDPRR
jgi:hypothetical protein